MLARLENIIMFTDKLDAFFWLKKRIYCVVDFVNSNE